MPNSSSRKKHTRPSGGERVFADNHGWHSSAASLTEEDSATVIFTCITNGRQSGRALAVKMTGEVGDVTQDTLRGWLEAAPRNGRLT